MGWSDPWGLSLELLQVLLTTILTKNWLKSCYISLGEGGRQTQTKQQQKTQPKNPHTGEKPHSLIIHRKAPDNIVKC